MKRLVKKPVTAFKIFEKKLSAVVVPFKEILFNDPIVVEEILPLTFDIKVFVDDEYKSEFIKASSTICNIVDVEKLPVLVGAGTTIVDVDKSFGL